MTARASSTHQLLRPDVHVPALDGVRGLAIALVVLLHFAQVLVPPAGTVGEAVAGVLAQGWVGVDLFFVLSGFLITGILLDARGAEPTVPAGYYRSFYVRRALRIFPPYYAFLAVMLWLVPPPRVEGQWWYWAYLGNALVSVKGWDATGEIGHLWSLAIEEQFYLVWPAVVALCSAGALRRLGVAVLIGAPVLRAALMITGVAIGHPTAGAVWSYVLTPARSDALVLGALLAQALRTPGGVEVILRWRRVAGAFAVSVIAALIAWAHTQGSSWWVDQWPGAVFGYSAIALLGGILVFAAARSNGGRVARVFGCGPLRWLGKYSYGIYLVHHALRIPVLALVAPGQSAFQRSPSWGLWLAYMTSAVALSLSLAYVSWHLFEKHWLSLKRYAPMPFSRGGLSAWKAPSEGVAAGRAA
jgi:peptidoglycan/LPS O-acetylase OafA/YrhL